jgi:hypothetical protein
MSEPIFSLLHPTVRPKAWAGAAVNWFKNADHPENVEYVLVPEKTDEFTESDNLRQWLPFENAILAYNQFPASTVGGSNYAASLATGKVLITLADDFYSAPHWDTNLLKLLDGKLDQEVVVWPDTGIPSFDDHFISLPILTRAYYEKIGYLFWHEYTSYYADADFTGQAIAQGVEIIRARDVLKFRHIRGGIDQSFPFDTDHHYQKNGGAAGEAGGKLYGRRSSAGFPI